MYYIRARWYDPGVAQFTSVDPELAATGNPASSSDEQGDDP
jgi:hypothetical protein